MNFVADEDIDAPIVERLRTEGHRVWYVAEMAAGLTDEAVLAVAQEQQALLLTADKGFGELVFRQRQSTQGVLLIRLAGLSQNRKAEIVASAIGQYGDELPGNFAVVSPGAIRVRKRS